MPSVKNNNSQSPSKKSAIEWIGRVVKVEENRTWYRKFSKEGIQIQTEEFVLLKPKNGGGSKVVQINQLWEEKKGTQVKRLLKGRLFTVSVPSSLQDNNKNNSDGLQILELLPTATGNAEYSVDSVDSKCHVKIVKDLKEVPNLKSSSRQSNRIYFLQAENVINENGKSPSKVMNEEIGTPSPQKQSKKENGDINTSPNRTHNQNGSSNSGKRKGSENGSEKKLSKKLKLCVPAMDQPETPKKRIVQATDEGSDSEEEKYYRKSLKRRLALEQQERQANREAREKWDQQNLNTKFFRLAHRRPDEEEQYQRLIEANLFDPSPLPADYEEPPQPTVLKPKYSLVVPGFTENSDYEEIANRQIDKDFWKSYRKGYIIFDPPEDTREIPSRESRESRFHPSSLASPIHHHTTHHLIAKYFEPSIWADVEVMLFKELLCAYGCDWHKIAGLMLSKKALQLELYYIDNRYDLSCQICGSTSDDAHLLLCDGCDRAYHLYCLDPPLSQVPNRQWFCTKECELINRMRCGACGLKDEKKDTLLCDSCDKAFHLACLNPPMNPTPPSWVCAECLASKAAAAASVTTPPTNPESGMPVIDQSSKPEEPKEKLEAQTPKPPTPRTLRRKKKLEIDVSDLLPEATPNPESKPSVDANINNNNVPKTSTQYPSPSSSNNTNNVLSIALGTVNAAQKLPISPKEFNLHQIGMLSPLSSPLNKSPSPQKHSKTAKIHKTATKIAESVTSTFIYEDIRVYASKCVREINFLGLREDNLAQVSYSTLFTYFPDVSESKLGEYFDSILMAVDTIVNRAIANPVFSSQLTALQQQEHDQRLHTHAHVKKINNTQLITTNKNTNHTTTNRTANNKIIRPRKKLRKSLSDTARLPTTPTPRRKSDKEDDDGFGTQPRAWIFQANNTMYNIEKSVQELKLMTWFIKQHIHKIRAGDRVFIWVSGKDAGVIAVGTVMTDPANMSEAKGMKEYTLTSKMFNVVALRSVLRIDYVLPKRIEKAKLVKHSVLSKLTILRQPIGTNFKLTKAEATSLEQLITDAAGSDINQLIPAFSSEDVPDVLAHINAAKKDDDNNNNNNMQPETADNNNNNTPNNTDTIIDDVPITMNQSIEPLADSVEVDIKCEVCNSTSGDDEMLLCDSCDKGYHTYCLNPPLEQIPEDSWYCQNCQHKASHCKICDGVATESAPLTTCYQCHVAYHPTCLGSHVDLQYGPKWFCSDCQLSPQEITACKLYIGFQELHLVCRRLIQDKCEEVSRQHKKNMQANHPAKKVISRLQHLIAQLSQTRLCVLNSANMSFQAWKDSLVNSAPIVPSNNHLKMDEDL